MLCARCTLLRSLRKVNGSEAKESIPSRLESERETFLPREILGMSFRATKSETEEKDIPVLFVEYPSMSR